MFQNKNGSDFAPFLQCSMLAAGTRFRRMEILSGKKTPLRNTSWLSMKCHENVLVRLHPRGFAPLIYLNYRRTLRL